VQRLADVVSCSLFEEVGGASRIGFNLSYMLPVISVIIEAGLTKPSNTKEWKNTVQYSWSNKM